MTYFILFLGLFRSWLIEEEVDQSLIFGSEDFTDEEGVFDLRASIGALFGVGSDVID